MFVSKNALVCLSLCAALSANAAAQFAYAVAADTGLYHVNVQTAQAQLIGFTGTNMRGLAIDPDGKMFGTDTLGDLYRINPFTAQATKIDRVREESIETLDIENGNDGVHLWGTNNLAQPTFYEIDRATAGPIKVRKIALDMGPVKAMAWDENPNARNFIAFGDQPQEQTAWIVAPDPEAAQQLGPVGATQGAIRGIDFDPFGNLYGTTSLGLVVQLDPATFEVVAGQWSGPIEWYDLSFGTVVPEPAGIGILICGIGLMALRRKA